ncbi:hypothetical protein, partial [Methanosarcina mazei]|uniref:hypothetical protein n=1 Tax=Methanosarcina mazei TaxID=2209 RepID=UPI001C300325
NMRKLLLKSKILGISVKTSESMIKMRKLCYSGKHFSQISLYKCVTHSPKYNTQCEKIILST